MAWTIEFHPDVEKDLKKLHSKAQHRIFSFLRERLAPMAHPEKLGKQLKGEWSGLWRFRTGEYRIIAKLENETMVIFVLRVGHRKDIYK